MLIPAINEFSHPDADSTLSAHPKLLVLLLSLLAALPVGALCLWAAPLGAVAQGVPAALAWLSIAPSHALPEALCCSA